MSEDLIKRIEENKVIAIVRGVDPAVMIKLAQALYDGGVRFLEVTFDQKSKEFTKTTDAIKALCEAFEGKMEFGAGTVTSVELVKMAYDAGAKFIISPDCNVEVIKKTKELGMVSIPGALTPTEVLVAHEAGADFVKLFPAGCFGPSYVKALRGPISHVRLMCVGSIDATNVGGYFKAGCVGAGIGGSLTNKTDIANGNWENITKAAKDIYLAIKEAL